MINIRGYMGEANQSVFSPLPSFSVLTEASSSGRGNSIFNGTFVNEPLASINGTKSSYQYNIPVEAVVAFLSIIFVVGLIGNSIAVLIVVKKRRMQTFTNWLILNLAIADLLVALICIPLEIPLEINGGSWIYGKAFCSIFYPIQTTTVYGSVFTLVALSFSRYWAIIHPFRKQPTIHLAKILIGIIWMCSIVVVVPLMTVTKYENGLCVETWTERQRQTYTIALFAFQFVIPISFIAIAYVSIIRELCYKKRSTAIKVDKVKEMETKKVVKLLLVITVTFAVCVLPYHIMTLIQEFGGGNFPYFDDINVGTYILLYLNSALNPIIYNVFNESFRSSFTELYKTVFAYMTNSTSQLEHNFFSSQRLSQCPDAQNWYRFSIAQSVGNRSSILSHYNRSSLGSDGKASSSLLSTDSMLLSPSYEPQSRYLSTPPCTKYKNNDGQESGNSSPVFV